MHLLAKSGARDTATVAPIEGIGVPSDCLPEIRFTKPLSSAFDDFYLGSTKPISVADGLEVDATDKRASDGIERYLRENGVTDPRVKVIRIFVTDLDRDGKREGIVEAITANRDAESLMSQEAPGDFSIIAVGPWDGARFRVSAHVGYIAGRVGAGPNFYAAALFELVALPDYFDSGSYTVAVGQAGYEWTLVQIFSWINGSLRRVATAYCGV
jgi:hypothetical protein